MEISRELYERVSKATGWNYEPIYQKEAEAPVIAIRIKIEGMLEDLLLEITERDEKIETLEGKIEHLEDKIKDIEKDIEDNYKRIPVSKQVRV